jgi:5-methylcytosine-specific restriction endonuclease McrA
MACFFESIYNRQHLFCSCTICESVVSLQSLNSHLQGHLIAGSDMTIELPYACRKCKYKTTSRHALLQHFNTKHFGSSACICPFCLTTFKICATSRRRQITTFPDYVDHVLSHDAGPGTIFTVNKQQSFMSLKNRNLLYVCMLCC